MIDLSLGESFTYPFPYIVVENCFTDNVYTNLKKEFPDVSQCDAVMGGRKTMNVSSHALNEHFLSWINISPTWKQFYTWFTDDSILHTIIDYYQAEITKFDSPITKKSSINTDCFVHMDWSASGDGYSREIHRDSDKRIWNFLIFFSNKDWDGGDFLIHSSDQLTEYPCQIWNNSLPIDKTIEAKENMAIFFLSTPNSYHSVSTQSYTRSDRKFIYGSLSYRLGDAFLKRSK
jgi:hypothetical protein